MHLSSPSNCFSETATRVDIKQVAAMMTIAKIARSVTVKIDTSCGNAGSGVIVKREESTYSVLTADCVVNSPDAKYTIRTNTGKNYPVTTVLRLQCPDGEPDLALLQFSTSDAYPVASVSHSDEIASDTDIYVCGYPRTNELIRREFEFTNGIMIERFNSKFLHYYSPTWSGMMGAPVFNSRARLIGIHIGGAVESERGMGFNIAVPLITSMNLLARTQLS